VSEDAAPEPRFVQLIPATPDALTADDALRDWRDEPVGEGVALNMIASVDGRIAVGGRSAPLGSPADRALFHALRARADAVMAGAGTVRIERYGPIIKRAEVRARRRAEGLPEQPLAVIVSRSLAIDPTVPLLADPGSTVVVLTPSGGELEGCAARIEYVRTATLREGLAELRARFGVRRILCEGGPSLNGTLAQEGLIDELFLAIAPLLVGETEGARAIVEDGAPGTPVPLELRSLLAHEDQLFARYASASG
jgi:riboflavin-specific deaminase-like protein